MVTLKIGAVWRCGGHIICWRSNFSRASRFCSILPFMVKPNEMLKFWHQIWNLLKIALQNDVQTIQFGESQSFSKAPGFTFAFTRPSLIEYSKFWHPDLDLLKIALQMITTIHLVQGFQAGIFQAFCLLPRLIRYCNSDTRSDLLNCALIIRQTHPILVRANCFAYLWPSLTAVVLDWILSTFHVNSWKATLCLVILPFMGPTWNCISIPGHWVLDPQQKFLYGSKRNHSVSGDLAAFYGLGLTCCFFDWGFSKIFASGGIYTIYLLFWPRSSATE